MFKYSVLTTVQYGVPGTLHIGQSFLEEQVQVACQSLHRIQSISLNA
jgi:hypothetical protein